MSSLSYQSLGLLPLTTILMSTCFGPGFGIGESTISTLPPLWTIASFIVAFVDRWALILKIKAVELQVCVYVRALVMPLLLNLQATYTDNKSENKVLSRKVPDINWRGFGPWPNRAIMKHLIYKLCVTRLYDPQAEIELLVFRIWLNKVPGHDLEGWIRFGVENIFCG